MQKKAKERPREKSREKPRNGAKSDIERRQVMANRKMKKTNSEMSKQNQKDEKCLNRMGKGWKLNWSSVKWNRKKYGVDEKASVLKSDRHRKCTGKENNIQTKKGKKESGVLDSKKKARWGDKINTRTNAAKIQTKKKGYSHVEE